MDEIAANKGTLSGGDGGGCISDRYISGLSICLVDRVVPPIRILEETFGIFDVENNLDSVR